MVAGIGSTVDDFSLPLLEGSGRRSLQDFVDGRKGALIVFWSGVCTHCNRYDGYFSSFTDTHPDVGFAAIASRYGETPQQMKQAVGQRRLRFPILLDADGSVARQWRAQQTPRCYLVGADRTLLYRGAVDNFKAPQDDQYLAYLEPALASFVTGRPIERPETASFGCAIQTVYYQLPQQL
jgi:hypothetical protein